MEKKQPQRLIKIINGNEYEIIPSERGYAYIISISLGIIIVCLFSHCNSLGLLYNDLLIEIGAGADGLTLMLAVFSICVSVSGIIANVAIKWFSLRKVGIFAAILYTSGWILLPFVQNINQLIITFSFFIGLGTGMLFTLYFTAFNTYFFKKRVMILSLIQFITCSITMIYPLIVEKLLEEFGNRGTLLILSAVMTHVIFAVISFHPVEWHSTKILCYIPIKNVKSKVEEQNDTSLLTYGVFKKTVKNVIEFLDLSLLNDLVLLNLLVVISLSLLADISFVAIFPQYLYDRNLSTADVASCLSILGASDLCGRAFLAIFSKFCKVRSELILYFVTIITTLYRIGFFFCNTYTSLKVITIVMGFCRAFIQSLNTLAFAEYIPERFSAALSLMMLFHGFVSFPVMMILGFLYNHTGSCVPGFAFLTTINALCLIPWTIKLYYFKMKTLI